MKKIAAFFLPFILCGIFTWTACNSGSEHRQKNEVLHPTEANKKPLKPVDYTITDDRSTLWLDSTDLELVTTIGIATGDKKYMIGEVTDLDAEGNNVILLDRKNSRITSYDMGTGNFIQQFSNRGRGPGEIMFPMKIAVINDLVIVSDRLLKAEIFKLTGGSYEHYGQISLEFSGDDLCAIDSLLFLGGYHFEKNEHTVHKYNLNTRNKLGSFHPPYQSDSQLAKITLSNKRISCNSESKTVVVASHYLPFIYGYSTDGQIKWTS